MNSALPREARANRTLVHSNPVLSRLSKVSKRTQTNSATCAGIAAKTSCFLLVTLLGMLAQLLVKAAMAGEPVWQVLTIYERFTLTLTMKEAMIVGAVLVIGLCTLQSTGLPEGMWQGCRTSSRFCCLRAWL